jgi:hypothetical protein
MLMERLPVGLWRVTESRSDPEDEVSRYHACCVLAYGCFGVMFHHQALTFAH